MNTNSLVGLLLASSTIGIVATNLFIQSSNAQTPPTKDRINFYCGEITDKTSGKTVPATMAYVPERGGSVSVILWKTHIPEWDAQRQCEVVSPKFQAFYEDGRINYLTTGVNNGYDIICAALKEGQTCKPEDQLFQVKASNNPKSVLKDLTGIIEGDSSKPIYQNSGDKIYVSVEELLNTAPVFRKADLKSN